MTGFELGHGPADFPPDHAVDPDGADRNFTVLGSGRNGPAGTTEFTPLKTSLVTAPPAEVGAVGIAGNILRDQTVLRIFFPPGRTGTIR